MQTDASTISLATAEKMPEVRTPKPAPQKSAPGNQSTAKAKASSKQAKVLAMLQSATGTTIIAMMRATKWQQHSVRGFLSAVVRKRLRLKLTSKLNAGGTRIYRVGSGAARGAAGKAVRKSR